MKTFTFLALATFLFVLSSCKQNSPAPSNPSPTAPTTPSTTPTSSMTALEKALVGSWKLKRTESRLSSYYQLYGDCTFAYTNHYNYYNSILELKSTSSTSVPGYYDCVWGIQDAAAPYSFYGWKGGPNNSISLTNAQSFFVIKYLSTDSMILDISGGLQRCYYSKNTITPKMNNIELKLIGNPWKLISTNGVAPSTPTYKIFKNNWFGSGGYLSIDSMNNYSFQGTWQVLFPNRAIPILSPLTKIMTLTQNNLCLETINNYGVGTSTLVYSR